MKELTWTEAFLGSKTLKQYREENHIFIPEEYRISVQRMAEAMMFWSFVLGTVGGYLAGSI